jgi:hypothetical protein
MSLIGWIGIMVFCGGWWCLLLLKVIDIKTFRKRKKEKKKPLV